MSYIGIPPFGQTVRSVTTATATSGQTTFNISGGYVVGYVDVYLNGLLLAPTAYTATNGTTVVLGTGATVGDKFQALSYQPVSLIDSLKVSNNLSDVASASTARTNLGLGSIATQAANNVSISGGSIAGITDLAVADGGTGASSLTANNVILGNGTSPVQFVAPGTAGNVLTSDGTTWTSAAAAGGAQDFDLVTNYSFSGQAYSQFDITGLTTTAGIYLMVGHIVFSGDSQSMSLSLRSSTDNGSTFYSGTSSYMYDSSNSSSVILMSNITRSVNGSQTNPGVTWIKFFFRQPSAAHNSDLVQMVGQTTSCYKDSITGGVQGHLLNRSIVLNGSTSPVNALRFFRSTGTATYTDAYFKIYKLAMS